MAYKPGSRISQVHNKFTSEGADAAHTLGVSLGLAPNTLRNWLRVFAKELNVDASDVTKRISTPKVAIQRSVNTPGNTIGKKRFHLSYWPEMTGVIVVEGPQQSQVRFDTTELGNHTAFPNEHLIIEKDKKDAKRRSKSTRK
jgi:hypothetical protein